MPPRGLSSPRCPREVFGVRARWYTGLMTAHAEPPRPADRQRVRPRAALLAVAEASPSPATLSACFAATLVRRLPPVVPFDCPRGPVARPRLRQLCACTLCGCCDPEAIRRGPPPHPVVLACRLPRPWHTRSLLTIDDDYGRRDAFPACARCGSCNCFAGWYVPLSHPDSRAGHAAVSPAASRALPARRAGRSRRGYPAGSSRRGPHRAGDRTSAQLRAATG